MRLEICRPNELGVGERQAWSAIQRQRTELQNPFLSSVFAMTVAEVDPRARVAVLFDGEEIVGFVPFHHSRSGIATGLARGVAGCEGLIISSECEFDPKLLLDKGRVSVWEFDQLVSTVPIGDRAKTSVKRTSLIEVGEGFDAYLRESEVRHKKYFNWLRRKRQRTEADLGPICFQFGTDSREALCRLIEWKSDQYRRSGWRDPFAKPWVHELVERLTETHEPELTGVLSSMMVHDKLLSVDFSLRSQSVYAGWFVTYNQEFSHFSPGAVRWLYVIKACADDQMAWIDLGAGDEEYKQKLANRNGDVLEGYALCCTPRAALRRVTRGPRAALERAILSHPTARATVRSSLRRVGRVRTGLTGRLRVAEARVLRRSA